MKTKVSVNIKLKVKVIPEDFLYFWHKIKYDLQGNQMFWAGIQAAAFNGASTVFQCMYVASGAIIFCAPPI